jgi:predicted metal-binding transcription factor (methanogenesis marker protein 9)|tara:strand:- start:298 stop:543 length:246 start_codon:yes stop_codon:yes gene_type:complete
MNIKNEIRKINSLSELNDLSAFLKDCKVMLGKSTLSVGSKVWCVQKTKKTPGVITKMNIKKAIVDMNGMLYNVPFSMLEAA